jgi:hypothetical protein
MTKTISSDWRVTAMTHVRKLIQEADPDVVEEQKYKMPTKPDGIPVWYHGGMICTGETYKEHLRLTFSKAKALKKEGHEEIFNAFNAIIIRKDDKINETAFKKLIKSAVTLNQQNKNKK